MAGVKICDEPASLITGIPPGNDSKYQHATETPALGDE